MSDIVEELAKSKFNEMIEVEGIGKVCGLGRVPVSTDIIQRAISEIERLRADLEHVRAVAGLAIEGQPFSEMKKEMRG